LNTGLIDAAMPCWTTWPARWTGFHGPIDINDPVWADVETESSGVGYSFKGPLSGNDTAGNGPYYSTVTSGAIPNTGSACPSQPAGSPIPASDWPTGNNCTTVTVDGEPGDPSPAYYAAGTISVSGTTVTGNAYWTSFMDQAQMQIGNNFYIFTFVDLTHGTLDSSPGTLTNVPYTLYLEHINNPKVGNPNFAYLQDAAVRDLFCILPNGGGLCGNQYYPGSAEIVRLIVKNGTSWTLQRGYAGSNGMRAPTPLSSVGANGWLYTFPTSCGFASDYPCALSRTLWDFIDDPMATNTSGNTIRVDANDQGCCHATRQGVNIDLANVCPTRDNNGSGCYNVRFAGLPAAFTAPSFNVASNPVFHGLVGVGYPNPIDIHPGHTQYLASPNENRWIGDARPFLGDDAGTLTGSISSPGVQLSGNLYKFTSSQTGRLRPRVLPTMAACGANPLLDISGPASTITGGSSNAYNYCITLNGGECVSGSSPGDVYVNCPQIKDPYCSYQGVGGSDPETRDICVTDMGAYALSATQVGVNAADPNGQSGRRVTHAFSYYHWLNTFWNVKMLPKGDWMLVWSDFMSGQRNALLLVKVPPFPGVDGVNRTDYIPYSVTIPAKPGVNNALVQFGYNTSYFCTSRQEVCLQGNGTQFNYQSEHPAGVPCTNGCKIPVPAISQRVLYYQVILRDVNNNILPSMSPEVRAIP
jgi:hypothetical protein